MRARKRSLGLGAALACCCALVAAPALAGSSARHPTDAHNHRAAVRDAARLLALTPLPSGATPSSQEPSGDGGVLGEPAFTEGAVKQVDRHAWWTVNEPPDQVFSYVQSHAPSGGTENTTCSGGGSGPQSRCVGFGFSPQHGVLGIRELAVEIVGLGNGTTGIRADAEVQWIINRPAAERVPAGVGFIEVVKAAPGQPPSVSREVSDPAQVSKIIQLIDGLPILQPGFWGCPIARTDASMVTVTFNQESDGPTLAQATVPADATNAATGCDAMSFSVNGTAQPPLVRGLHFLRAVGSLLGVQLSDPGG